MSRLLPLLLVGCAAGGAAGGGDTDLPNRGFVPYEVVMDAERVARILPGLGSPRADVVGGKVVLLAERCAEACEWVRLESLDGLDFGAPSPADAPHDGDFSVEDGAVFRADREVFRRVAPIDSAEVRPTATAAGRDLFRMVFTSEGSVGFAASEDGTAWSEYAFNPVLSGGFRAASNVRLGDRYLLYLESTERIDGKLVPFIALAIDDAGHPTESF